MWPRVLAFTAPENLIVEGEDEPLLLELVVTEPEIVRSWASVKQLMFLSPCYMPGSSRFRPCTILASIGSVRFSASGSSAAVSRCLVLPSCVCRIDLGAAVGPANAQVRRSRETIKVHETRPSIELIIFSYVWQKFLKPQSERDNRHRPSFSPSSAAFLKTVLTHERMGCRPGT